MYELLNEQRILYDVLDDYDKLIKELVDCDCSWKTINEFIFEKERILTRLQEIEFEKYRIIQDFLSQSGFIKTWTLFLLKKGID